VGSLRLQSAVDLDRRVDVDAFLLLCWRFLLLGRPQWSGDLRRRFGGERGGRQTLGKSARESALSASVRASDEFVASYHCAATVYRLKESNRQPNRQPLRTPLPCLSSSVKMSDDGVVVAKNGLIYDVVVH